MDENEIGRQVVDAALGKENMFPSIWTGMYAELPLPEALRMLYACGWQRFEISTEHLVSIETSDDPESLIEETLLFIQQHRLSTPQAHALLHANVAAMDKQKREQDIQRLLYHIEIAARFAVKTLIPAVVALTGLD
ncbi:MAG: hypothetical protein K9N51_10350 [Candidatus Pacebacteria bacterium]|nr:hypothetical protein [Candidatus Paceibacterota bacterium]